MALSSNTIFNEIRVECSNGKNARQGVHFDGNGTTWNICGVPSKGERSYYFACVCVLSSPLFPILFDQFDISKTP